MPSINEETSPALDPERAWAPRRNPGRARGASEQGA